MKPFVISDEGRKRITVQATSLIVAMSKSRAVSQWFCVEAVIIIVIYDTARYKTMIIKNFVFKYPIYKTPHV